MERKVFGRTVLSVRNALLVVGLLSASHAWAGGGGLGGVATEVTQLRNNIELVMEVIQSAKTVVNTANTVLNLDKVLKNMDPRVLAEIAGIPKSDFDQLYALRDDVNGVLSAYKDLAGQMQNFQTGVQMTGLSPSQYLAAQAQAAQQYGGFYKKVFESQQKALQRAIDEQEGLSADLATISSNTGVVDSVKQMSGQLVQTRATLLSMLQQMQQANMLAAAQKASDGYAAQAQAQRDLEKYTTYMNAQQQSLQNGTLPDPTKIQLNKGTSP